MASQNATGDIPFDEIWKGEAEVCPLPGSTDSAAEIPRKLLVRLSVSRVSRIIDSQALKVRAICLEAPVHPERKSDVMQTCGQMIGYMCVSSEERPIACPVIYPCSPDTQTISGNRSIDGEVIRARRTGPSQPVHAMTRNGVEGTPFSRACRVELQGINEVERALGILLGTRFSNEELR